MNFKVQTGYKLAKEKNYNIDDCLANSIDLRRHYIHLEDGIIKEIDCSPTSNCQLFSIPNFYFYLNERYLEKLDCILTSIFLSVLKPLLLIDIKDIYCGIVREIFKEHILFEVPYINTYSKNYKLSIFTINIRDYLKTKYKVSNICDIKFAENKEETISQMEIIIKW